MRLAFRLIFVGCRLAQIDEVSADKENTQTQVQALRADISLLQSKQKQIDKEASKEMPQNKVHLELNPYVPIV
jgi:hypothetical protein